MKFLNLILSAIFAVSIIEVCTSAAIQMPQAQVSPEKTAGLSDPQTKIPAGLIGKWTSVGYIVETQENFQDFKARILKDFRADGSIPPNLQTTGFTGAGTGSLILKQDGTASFSDARNIINSDFPISIKDDQILKVKENNATDDVFGYISPRQNSLLAFVSDQPGSSSSSPSSQPKPFFVISVYSKIESPLPANTETIITKTMNGITVTIDKSAGPKFTISEPVAGIITISELTSDFTWGIQLLPEATSKWVSNLVYGKIPDGWTQINSSKVIPPALSAGKTYNFTINTIFSCDFTM